MDGACILASDGDTTGAVGMGLPATTANDNVNVDSRVEITQGVVYRRNLG